jgi:tetratricopeptide (TPR) repeat protein
MQRKTLGDEHPDVAKSIYSLGELMRRRGNLAESHAVLTAALSIQRKLLGDEHPDVLATLRGLALTLERETNWAAAESVRRAALATWRRQSGDEDPHTLTEFEGLVRALHAQKKLADAEQILAEVLTPAFAAKPASLKLLVARINLFGPQGRWAEAARDAALALRHQPDDHYRYHTLAPLLAITDQRAAYEEVCRLMLATFTNTSNPYVAERVVKDCLLWPAEGVEYSTMDRLADIAVNRGGGEKSLPFFQVAKALSSYRQGRFTEALEWADEALKGKQTYARAHACAVAAMANWRLGKRDEARAMLNQGDGFAPAFVFTPQVETLGSDWLAWLVARISLNEAKTLIESKRTK